MPGQKSVWSSHPPALEENLPSLVSSECARVIFPSFLLKSFWMTDTMSLPFSGLFSLNVVVVLISVLKETLLVTALFVCSVDFSLEAGFWVAAPSLFLCRETLSVFAGVCWIRRVEGFPDLVAGSDEASVPFWLRVRDCDKLKGTGLVQVFLFWTLPYRSQKVN